MKHATCIFKIYETGLLVKFGDDQTYDRQTDRPTDRPGVITVELKYCVAFELKYCVGFSPSLIHCALDLLYALSIFFILL